MLKNSSLHPLIIVEQLKNSSIPKQIVWQLQAQQKYMSDIDEIFLHICKILIVPQWYQTCKEWLVILQSFAFCDEIQNEIAKFLNVEDWILAHHYDLNFVNFAKFITGLQLPCACEYENNCLKCLWKNIVFMSKSEIFTEDILIMEFKQFQKKWQFEILPLFGFIEKNLSPVNSIFSANQAANQEYKSKFKKLFKDISLSSSTHISRLATISNPDFAKEKISSYYSKTIYYDLENLFPFEKTKISEYFIKFIIVNKVLNYTL